MLCKSISLRHAASSEVTLVPSTQLHPLSFLISCHLLLSSSSFGMTSSLSPACSRRQSLDFPLVQSQVMSFSLGLPTFPQGSYL